MCTGLESCRGNIVVSWGREQRNPSVAGIWKRAAWTIGLVLLQNGGMMIAPLTRKTSLSIHCVVVSDRRMRDNDSYWRSVFRLV
jgi:hypothetical protein